MTQHPVVTVDWLAQHLEDQHVVVVDCRFALMQPEQGRQLYQESHIPGAYYLDLNQDLSGPVGLHGGRHPLPEVERLAQTLSQIGVHSDPPAGPTLVVAYDDSRLAFAARLWWLLRYLGHESVAVLDGGFASWQAAGLPISNAIPPARRAQFRPRVQSERVVQIEQVKAPQTPATILVDSREGARYRGEEEPIDPIAGHIPGAVNYPWQEVTGLDGKLRPVAEQQQRWASLATAEDIIVYCGSGVTACVNLLSMELAGVARAKLYAGSWSDWCSYDVNP